MRLAVILFILSVSVLTHARQFCADLFTQENAAPMVSQSETSSGQVSKDARNLPFSVEEIKAYLKTEEVLFEHGKYKNKSVDQSKNRPIQRISEFETEHHYFTTQFYHQGKFWIARIPKQSVRDVIFQLALFKGPIGKTLAHAQLRFITTEPLLLFRLKNGEVVYNESRDFIFTVQASFPVDQKYDAKQAVLGNYLAISRMVNTFDRAYTEEILDNDQVTQYRLANLTTEQKNNLLENSVDFSSQKMYSTRYSVRNANCINLLFDVIDRTLNRVQPRLELTWRYFFFKGKSPNEKMALDALKERNLINEQSKLPDYTRRTRP